MSVPPVSTGALSVLKPSTAKAPDGDTLAVEKAQQAAKQNIGASSQSGAVSTSTQGGVNIKA